MRPEHFFLVSWALHTKATIGTPSKGIESSIISQNKRLPSTCCNLHGSNTISTTSPNRVEKIITRFIVNIHISGQANAMQDIWIPPPARWCIIFNLMCHVVWAIIRIYIRQLQAKVDATCTNLYIWDCLSYIKFGRTCVDIVVRHRSTIWKTRCQPGQHEHPSNPRLTMVSLGLTQLRALELHSNPCPKCTPVQWAIHFKLDANPRNRNILWLSFAFYYIRHHFSYIE